MAGLLSDKSLVTEPLYKSGLLSDTPEPDWQNNTVIQGIFKDNPIIKKIIQAESSGNRRAFNKDSQARGLMQITPITALGGVDEQGNKTYAHGLYGKTLTLLELYDAEKNVKFGTAYFNALKKSFGSDRNALIAYNWGPGNFKEWRAKGSKFQELPDETKKYLVKILGKKYAKK
jgi:soluble lytic murein transglycosylase|tara:strand:- start:10682 stop:11203 length:522 start_codon:yes stop_codon:yes gene_type:complete